MAIPFFNKTLKMAFAFFIIFASTNLYAANKEILFEDKFKQAFSAAGGPGDNWFYFASPPFIGNDGITSRQGNTLNIKSPGTHPITGDPAFTLTMPQGPFGGLDHVKWLVYTNHFNPDNGLPGYKSVDGKELVCESWMSGRTFGTENHPFGAAVDNANDDLRLASFAMNTLDVESWMVFDFFFTNEKVYAFYERLPFGKGGPLGNYAAFSYMIPVADRAPSDHHHIEIAYDKQNGTVRWLLDDEEVFKVTEIGKSIDSQYLTIHHGGDEPINDIVLNQMNCGMGTFTLLDGHLPSQTALVRLSNIPGFYLNPDTNAPQTFVDESSLSSSRLFGQGVEMNVSKYIVKYINTD